MFIGLLAGDGYNLLRCLLWYGLVVAGFAAAYYWLAKGLTPPTVLRDTLAGRWGIDSPRHEGVDAEQQYRWPTLGARVGTETVHAAVGAANKRPLRSIAPRGGSRPPLPRRRFGHR